MNFTRPTVQGEKLDVSLKNNNVMFSDAHVTTSDVAVSIGVVQLIDKVLMPRM